MKSERRHQLEQNELADRLGSGIAATQSYLPMILGGLGVLVVGAIAWGIYSSSSEKKTAVAWTEFYFNLASGDAESYVDLAQEFPASSAAGWARLVAGDNFLQRGIESLYRNKAEGVALIEQAIDAFEEVEQDSTTTELRTKALLGLAQANESLGKLEEAANFYQQVAKSTTHSGILREANERLSFLASESGKEFYAWFGKLDPKPDAPIELPSDMQSPPLIPDLQFGPSDADTSPAADDVQAEIDASTLSPLPDLGTPDLGAAPADSGESTDGQSPAETGTAPNLNGPSLEGPGLELELPTSPVETSPVEAAAEQP
jgi:hypothetical protein